MEAREIKKLYYSISEVSDITELKQYVLRYWETEFSQLKPTKNKAGNRTYRSNDIDIILEIKSLLYERKFTIKGAQQFLKKGKAVNGNMNSASDAAKIIKLSNSADTDLLIQINENIKDLKKLIKNFKD